MPKKLMSLDMMALIGPVLAKLLLELISLKSHDVISKSLSLVSVKSR